MMMVIMKMTGDSQVVMLMRMHGDDDGDDGICDDDGDHDGGSQQSWAKFI